MENSQTMRVTPGSSVNCDLETGEIDLGLLARRRLEAHLEWLDRLRPDVAHGPLHGRVTAAIASLTQLATQPHGREAG